MEEVVVGRVERYFGKIGVAAIRITSGELKVGDRIRIRGHTTDFEQVVESMQVEHATVEKVEAGNDVGIRVKETARDHDTVFLIRD